MNKKEQKDLEKIYGEFLVTARPNHLSQFKRHVYDALLNHDWAPMSPNPEICYLGEDITKIELDTVEVERLTFILNYLSDGQVCTIFWKLEKANTGKPASGNLAKIIRNVHLPKIPEMILQAASRPVVPETPKPITPEITPIFVEPQRSPQDETFLVTTPGGGTARVTVFANGMRQVKIAQYIATCNRLGLQALQLYNDLITIGGKQYKATRFVNGETLYSQAKGSLDIEFPNVVAQKLLPDLEKAGAKISLPELQGIISQRLTQGEVFKTSILHVLKDAPVSKLLSVTHAFKGIKDGEIVGYNLRSCQVAAVYILQKVAEDAEVVLRGCEEEIQYCLPLTQECKSVCSWRDQSNHNEVRNVRGASVLNVLLYSYIYIETRPIHVDAPTQPSQVSTKMCPFCATTLPIAAKFCNKCGTKF